MSKYCSKCGKEIRDGIKFCPNCGAKIEKSIAQISESMRNEERVKKGSKHISIKIIAGVVAMVIVGAGAYMGYSYSKETQKNEKIDGTDSIENSSVENKNSEPLTETKIQNIRKKLNVPDTNKITYELGKPYELDDEFQTQLVEIKFKKKSKEVAGAVVNVKTGEVAKDISTYIPVNSREEENMFNDIPDYEIPLKYQVEAYNQQNSELFYKSMKIQKGYLPEWDDYMEEEIKSVVGIVYEIYSVSDYDPKSNIDPDIYEQEKDIYDKLEEGKIIRIGYDKTEADGNTYHGSTNFKVYKMDEQWYAESNLELL